MDSEFLIGLGVVAVLIAANAVFVATEFAYVTARRARLAERAEAGDGTARVALDGMRNLDRYIASSQLGITMASIALGFVGEPILAHAMEPTLERLVGSFAPAAAHAIAVAVALFLITAAHLIFGEMAPKTVALQKPESVALFVAWPMRIFTLVFSPVISLLNGAGNTVLRLLGIPVTPIGHDQQLSAQDLAYAFESSASVGIISRRELFLGRRALSLGEVPVRNLMLPRDAIRTIDVAADRAEVLRQVGEHRRSRYPVVRGSLDDVVGLIDVKRLLLGPPDEDWHAAVVPILYLPDSTTAGRAIEVLGEASDQLVLVTDEYGNVDGMLGLVDVLEFLAGPLPDERDHSDREPRKVGADRYLVPGLYRVERAREAPLKLPVGDTDVETIGGLMAERLQRVPRVGDRVHLGDRTIRVVEMVERRVHLVEVTPTRDEKTEGR